MKLFVSYRRAAWSFTYWLVEELGKLLDAEIFVDYSGMDESNFQSALLRNLRESDAVLVIVTAETFAADRIHHDKDWVRRELREALTLKKPMALALHNGLTPPADLPTDVQAVRDVQGIEFYPRYFKAGVHDLAAFIDRATPIKLREPVTTLDPAAVPEPAATDKGLFDRATALAEAGQYDPALDLLGTLQGRGYRPKYVTLEAVITDITREREAELRRWEAGQHYDEIAALMRISVERARAAWAQYRAEYPEVIDDPAGLGERLRPVPPSAHPQPLPQTPSTTERVANIAVRPPAAPPSPPQPQSGTTPRPARRQRTIGWWLRRGIAVSLVLAGVIALYVGGRFVFDYFNFPAALFIPKLPAASVANIITPTRNSQWQPQSTWFDGVEMVLVPPGCFQMGSDDGGSDEQPVHRQCIPSAFYLDRYEVTNAQFAAFGGQTGKDSRFTLPQRPREQITWAESRDFCAKRGGRLPTEAEWEWAARGPDSLVYPWGNTFVGDNVVYGGNFGGQTANVGSKPAGASWVGALDLSGNVWEWTSTIYDQDKFPYPHTSTDNRNDININNAYRVIRGGSWGDTVPILRSAYRSWYSLGYGLVGCRLARSS
jgi:iron(II)-dependent oxidoreductase